MMVDTGATGCIAITRELADQLLAEKAAVPAGEMNVVLANGAKETDQVIVIKDAQVGIHKLHNIRAGVTNDNGAAMLLSLDVMNAIGPFKIDAKAGQIIFG
jgi:predicted aspartyl protease